MAFQVDKAFSPKNIHFRIFCFFAYHDIIIIILAYHDVIIFFAYHDIIILINIYTYEK